MKNLLLPLLAAAAVSFTACNDASKAELADKNELNEATVDTAVVARDGETVGDMASDAGNSIENAFDMSRAKLADVKFDEVKNTGTTVRGDADYSVYSVDETVLFDTDKATIKPGAAANLDEIVASIGQRYAGKDVRVMGFADSRGDAGYNMQLGQERATAVKNYLISKGIAADKLSTESFGEQKPVETNATPAGRKENRRVEIAVRAR